MNEKLKKTMQRLELYYKAEQAVLLRQGYRIGTKELTMADLNTIRNQISILETEIEVLQRNNGKRKVKRVIPLDI